MSEEVTSEPKIRFKGHTEDWERRKLEEVVNVRSGRDYKHLDSGDIPVYGTGGYMLSVGEALSYDEDAIGIGRKGTIDKPYILKAPFWTVDTLFYTVPKSNSDLNFIHSIFQKIGSFFKRLDDTIALHRRELDLLKQAKQSYLQKMFPKDGQNKPELRFTGFTDAWEQRMLIELATHRGGTAIEKYFSNSGNYKVISIGSYGLDNKYIDQGIRAVSNEITDKRLVKKNELTMVLNDKTANGSIIGRSLLIDSDNEFVINQRTEIISPKKFFNPSFAYTILNGPFREKIKKIVQGGTQIYVNYPAVERLTLSIPSKKEQEKIGLFFKQLDNTIALHQRKLDILESMKKSLLKQMFI